MCASVGYWPFFHLLCMPGMHLFFHWLGTSLWIFPSEDVWIAPKHAAELSSAPPPEDILYSANVISVQQYPSFFPWPRSLGLLSLVSGPLFPRSGLFSTAPVSRRGDKCFLQFAHWRMFENMLMAPPEKAIQLNFQLPVSLVYPLSFCSLPSDFSHILQRVNVLIVQCSQQV